jgi:multisubunit Na+/H+ antiporter MnhC subunit
MAWATLIMIAALLAQFVLGMAVNLFVTIPAHHPGASPKTTSSEPATAWAGPLPQACYPSPRP